MSDKGSAQPPYILALIVGVILIIIALLVPYMRLDFPYTALFVYAGVAALFSSIGANAAVKLNLGKLGQAGSATGAAALAIMLCWTIGRDVNISPKFDVIYYVNFPDGRTRDPDDLSATVLLADEHQSRQTPFTEIALGRAPGGNAVKLTVSGVSTREYLTIKMHSIKENKHWSSASVLATESFMNLNEGR